MTLCIAAINEGASAIITVSDFMVSNQWTSTQTRTVKAQWVPNAPTWVQMYAGEPTIDERVSEFVRRRITRGVPPDFDMVRGSFEEGYKAELCRRIEMEILGPLGMSREDFLEHGRAYLGEPEFLRWLGKVEEATLGTTFLVAGVEPTGVVRMFSIENLGVVRYWDRLGYHAIGSGDFLAIASLHRTFKFGLSLADTIYRLCEAKFLGEAAYGVGTHTMVEVVYANGACQIMWQQDVEALRSIWLQHGIPPVPEAARTEIGQRLKIADGWGKEPDDEDYRSGGES